MSLISWTLGHLFIVIPLLFLLSGWYSQKRRGAFGPDRRRSEEYPGAEGSGRTRAYGMERPDRSEGRSTGRRESPGSANGRPEEPSPQGSRTSRGAMPAFGGPSFRGLGQAPRRTAPNAGSGSGAEAAPQDAAPSPARRAAGQASPFGARPAGADNRSRLRAAPQPTPQPGRFAAPIRAAADTAEAPLASPAAERGQSRFGRDPYDVPASDAGWNRADARALGTTAEDARLAEPDERGSFPAVAGEIGGTAAMAADDAAPAPPMDVREAVRWSQILGPCRAKAPHRRFRI